METSQEKMSDTNQIDSTSNKSARTNWGLIAVIVLAGVILGVLIGYLWRGAAIPTADSADVGFARDMSVHHEQAVQMASLVYDRTEDDAIRSLAFDILTTQQGQIGIMSGWLDAWDHPWTSAGPRMGWMGMPTEGLMPGMATAEQLAALRAARGTQADIIFLQLMIPHHQGGVAMAQAAVEEARTTPVKLLAQGMVDAQSLEIDYMQELLQQKGAEPIPDMPPMEHQSDHSDH